MSTTTTARPAARRTPAPTAAERGAPRTGLRPARRPATTRPGGRLTAYGPVTTTARASRPAGVPTAAQVRTRVGTAVSVLALLGVLLVVAASRLLAPAGPGVPATTAVVTVQPGDTLSAIAAETAPEAPRQAVVDRIVELNGLGSPAVRAGQTITVPAAAAVVR